MQRRTLTLVAGKAPILGHSALRCAGLSQGQARLQAIPATLYLLGAFAMVAIWLKFAIERRVFAFRQVFSLSVTGVLGFAVVVAAVGLRLDGAGSASLGGLSAFVCIFQLLAIYYFLPSRYTLPRILDSLLAALFMSSAILNILASIHLGRLLPSSDSINVFYAECVCLICFYLVCICTSQFPRYFILIREDSIERQEGSEMMDIVPSITYILAMAFFVAQACLGVSLYPSFAIVMAASMASAVGFCLLVATFFIQNWSKRIPYSLNFQHGFDGIETCEKIGENAQRGGQDLTMQDTHHLAAPPILKAPSHPIRSPATVIRSDAGSVVWAGNVTPCPEATNPKTAKLDIAQDSAQSRASWDRIQYLMKRDQRARCASGVTDYGTETSYIEAGGRTQRRSMLSSMAMAVGGYGEVSVPPVPPISVNYLVNNNQSDITLQCYAEPLPMRGLRDDKTVKTANDDVAWPQVNGVLPVQYQSSKLFPAVEWQTGDSVLRGPSSASPVASDMKHSRSSSFSVGQSSSSFGDDMLAGSESTYSVRGGLASLAKSTLEKTRHASVQGARAVDPLASARIPVHR